MGLSQVLIISSLVPVMPNIPRTKAAQQAIHKNLGALILEEPQVRALDRDTKYDFDPEVQQSKDWVLDDKLEEEDFIPNSSMYSLGFEAMLRSTLPSKKSVKKDGSRETEFDTWPGLTPDTWGIVTSLAQTQYWLPSG